MATTPQIKVPQRSGDSRVEKALLGVSKDGQWHRLLEMGFSSAEQTARSLNSDCGAFEYGYTQESDGQGALRSVLWVRST